MEIKIHEGEHVRIGGSFPICMNVDAFDQRSGQNLMFSFYAGNGKTDHCLRHAEMRHKDGQYAIFMAQHGFGDDNAQMPVWWQDADLVWSLANNGVNADPEGRA